MRRWKRFLGALLGVLIIPLHSSAFLGTRPIIGTAAFAPPIRTIASCRRPSGVRPARTPSVASPARLQAPGVRALRADGDAEARGERGEEEERGGECGGYVLGQQAFSMIPAAPNFKGRIALRAIRALRAAGALNVMLPPEVVRGDAGQDHGLQGRVLFDLANPEENLAGLASLEGVESIRAVLLHALPSDQACGCPISLADWIASSAQWARGVRLLRTIQRQEGFDGGLAGGGERVHVRSRRSGPRFPEGAGHTLKRLLSLAMQRAAATGSVADEKPSTRTHRRSAAPRAWLPCAQRTAATLEVQVVLHGGGVLVEMPLLVQESVNAYGGLQHRGIKPPEAWAMARTLNIRANEMVLDPMCGSGGLLLEAARGWPGANFVGVDIDQDQVDRCVANAAQVGLPLQVLMADVSSQGGIPLPTASVDKILVDLPFGKKFGSLDTNPDLYPSALREMARVLRKRGRMVVLVDRTNLPLLYASLAAIPRSTSETERGASVLALAGSASEE
ncbi:hypothetical protein T484DRAFT_1908810, partial [Baffinella frigidus]